MKTEFNEEQKFTQWWLWLILSGVSAIPLIGIYYQFILNEQFGRKPIPDTGLIIFSLFVFMLIVMFWFIKLRTKIDENEIEMSFFPFVKKQVLWDEIENAKIVNYGHVGGYGIRLGTKYGTVYNIKGKTGLAIKQKNGIQFLIGTQKESELNNIIMNIIIKKGLYESES
ncbi:MAG: hypothetical protein V3V16_11480 [Melioribacteraceae bacterium]